MSAVDWALRLYEEVIIPGDDLLPDRTFFPFLRRTPRTLPGRPTHRDGQRKQLPVWKNPRKAHARQRVIVGEIQAPE